MFDKIVTFHVPSDVNTEKNMLLPMPGLPDHSPLQPVHLSHNVSAQIYATAEGVYFNFCKISDFCNFSYSRSLVKYNFHLEIDLLLI